MRILIFIILVQSILNADSISWKNKEGFNKLNIINGKITFLKDIGNAIEIAPSSVKLDKYTDLFLDFEFDAPSKLLDKTGNYKIKESSYYINNQIRFLNSLTAGFLKPEHIIKIKTTPENFFANSVDLEDFTIDFWIYPTLLNNCEIFKRGTYYRYKFYGITIGIKEKRLICEFQNFFYDSLNNSYDVTLSSKKNELKLKEWQNVSITFKKEDGILSLKINNNEIDTKIITKTGNPYDEVLIPHFLEFDNSDIIIGRNFLGYLDNFRISKIARDNIDIDFVNETNKCIITSKVIDLKNYDSKINEMELIFDNIEGSDIKVYIRRSNKKFKESENTITWEYTGSPTSNIFKLSKIEKLRYFQWKLEMLKLSEDANPYFISARLDYTPNYPPLPPKNLKLTKLEEDKIELVWEPNFESDIKGYIIYWGFKSGEYENRVDVGLVNSYILTLPEYNRYYFFTLTAYDSDAPYYNESEFSKEIKFFLKK